METRHGWMLPLMLRKPENQGQHVFVCDQGKANGSQNCLWNPSHLTWQSKSLSISCTAQDVCVDWGPLPDPLLLGYCPHWGLLCPGRFGNAPLPE